MAKSCDQCLSTELLVHTNYFAYESLDAAKSGVKENSSNFMTLNGTWRFNWVRDAEPRPTDFWKVKYDDSKWNDMQVPGVWEINGYGDPIYVNRRICLERH